MRGSFEWIVHYIEEHFNEHTKKNYLKIKISRCKKKKKLSATKMTKYLYVSARSIFFVRRKDFKSYYGLHNEQTSKTKNKTKKNDWSNNEWIFTVHHRNRNDCDDKPDKLIQKKEVDMVVDLKVSSFLILSYKCI